MDEFVHYIQTRDLAPFAPHEYNEVMNIMYRLLGIAARDGADAVTLTPTEVRWTRNDAVLNRFRTDLVPTTVSYRDELHRILARDTTVQRYVHALDSSDGSETFRLGETAGVAQPV